MIMKDCNGDNECDEGDAWSGSGQVGANEWGIRGIAKRKRGRSDPKYTIDLALGYGY